MGTGSRTVRGTLLCISGKPQFAELVAHDKSEWLRCLLWHGLLPQLTPRIGISPWAVSTSDSVDAWLETGLG